MSVMELPSFPATVFDVTYCRFANITLHHPCQIENTTYLETTPVGEPHTTIIIRDNCRTPGFYCNAANTKCEPTKPLQSKCQTDRECETVRAPSRVHPGSADWVILSITATLRDYVLKPPTRM